MHILAIPPKNKQKKKPPLKIAVLFVLFFHYTLTAEKGGLFLVNFAVSLNTKVLVCKEERELEHWNAIFIFGSATVKTELVEAFIM